MQGITLDSGALIAFQRGKQRMRTIITGARNKSIPVTVPAAVVVEWWRDGFGRREQDILEPLIVEPLTKALAMIAGAALTRIQVELVDAIVMASAAQRGDIVYTSDPEDLHALQAYFPGVKVLTATGE